ncbi:hypothetical protein CMV_014814 [Castanea mollissima]|uniref:Uncharacterized protein n=1 Tax=Castanea mollissima TaxID=60419 RepID=A0A8J4VKP6_9ROSI|nr:hypothetical protein CMV_014814 [Castanea mollissima]
MMYHNITDSRLDQPQEARSQPISGIETVVNRPTWIPSKNHPFTANIDAVVQNYQANPGKKLAGTGLFVVDQAYYPLCCGTSWICKAYYPLCCGTSWSSIDRKGGVLDNLELDVKAVCQWAKLVTDRYGLKDFHIQVDTLHIPQNLAQDKVLKDTPIDKTLKKIRDELLEGKGFSVELDWVSRHCNAVANSFAAIGSDVQFAKEGGADLSGFLLEKEFYAMNYPKWKGEGFSEFFDEESYRIWDKDTGFPKGFKEILLRTFRNRVIIPSDIHGRPTSFEIPEFNIVDPIGKQFLDLIHGEIDYELF